MLGYLSFTLKKLSVLKSLHEKIASQFWFKPIGLNKSLSVFILFVTAISITGNTLVRSEQLSDWAASDRIDSSRISSFPQRMRLIFWPRKVNNEWRSPGISVKEGCFPTTSRLQDADQAHSIKSRPLLSVLISFLAKSSDPAELITAGNQLIFLTATATTLMIVFSFGAAGYWLEGAVAALGGGLSAAYLVRSSIGRIDTDQMNLGFMYFIVGILLLAGRINSKSSSFVLCVAAGLVANLFMWWYGKPQLILMLTFILAWLLICLHRNFLHLILCISAFLFMSGVEVFNPFSSIYFKEIIEASHFKFPNTYQTITEVKAVSFYEILSNIGGSVEMGIVCLSGFAFFFARHPVISIAYAPLIGFALLNFIIGNRAIFYSAPIMWFGFAFFSTSICRFILFRTVTKLKKSNIDQLGSIIGAALALLIVWVNSPTDYTPRQSFPTPVLKGLASLKSSATTTNSVVATWWDYGFASALLNDLPTLHDGASSATPSTHFVAKALLSQNQTDLIGILKFLSTRGHIGISLEKTNAGLKAKFEDARKTESPEIYLVVTNQMVGWMGSISQIGNWDIERGEPILLRGNATGPVVNYQPLNCRLKGFPRKSNVQVICSILNEG